MQLSLSLPKFARARACGVVPPSCFKTSVQKTCMPSVCMNSAVSRQKQVLECEPSTSGRAFRAWCNAGRAGKVVVYASASEGAAPVYIMPPVTDPATEKEWLQLQMLEWLNEEWSAPTTVEPHVKLAEATAMAYMKLTLSLHRSCLALHLITHQGCILPTHLWKTVAASFMDQSLIHCDQKAAALMATPQNHGSILLFFVVRKQQLPWQLPGACQWPK
uniref:Uncharacterized protein n=1 Tax=Dunaliella tertiolecta TaxID=3047 RepID=A0A7S3QSC9_DUNTE